MEPNKFEQNLKEKLEGRTLQPSNEAWTKLSGRLDYENKKQNSKTFWWFGIAASVIGILFVGFQFFNIEEIKPVIVDAPTIIEQNGNPPAPVEAVEKPNTAIEKIQLNETPLANIKNNPIVIAEESSIPKERIQQQKPIMATQETLTFEAQKIQEIVGQVQQLKDKNQEVSDAAIDALLLQAQKEIRLQKIHSKTTGLVNANMLLEEVENDLDQSFRSKVFEAIKASYGTVKTAVAQRNN
uniref:hypothetical protein n=1 Tax=Mariniflexile sp. TaxID=1979402 RepID=UPI0040486C09